MPNSDEDHDPRDRDIMLAGPRPEDFAEVMPPHANQQLAPRQAVNLFGSLTTAQPVHMPRNIPVLMKKLDQLSQLFGENYLYSWKVKGGEVIEGGTIDLAMDLAREYGNNATEVREIEGPTHITFYCRFTDLETGYSTERAFRQRKGQNTGMKDADRAADMVYQIGQSKAIRNVILKALSNYADFMMTRAKNSVIEKIRKDKQMYLDSIMNALERFEIDLEVVEKSIGRPKKEWVEREIAEVFYKLKSVKDGMLPAATAFAKETPLFKSAAKETGSDAGAAAEDSDPKTETTAKASPKTERQAPAEGEANAAAATTKKTEKAEKADEKPVPAKGKPANKPKALFTEE